MRVLLLCVLLASAAEVRAESRIAIRASGSCPTAAAITRALPAATAQITDVELTVEEVPGGVIVKATSPTGPLEARLEGHDCDVLASAVAAIADAWFVELAPPPAPPPAMPVVPPSAVPRTDTDTAPAPVHRREPHYSLALGRALQLAQGATVTWSTQAELGLWLRPQLRLRARVDLGEDSTFDAVLHRQAWVAALALARRLDVGDRVWLEAAPGAGIALSQVEAMTGGDQVVRAHGALTLGNAAGFRLTEGASLRLDVDLRVYPVRDVYSLEGMPVARSPLAEVTAGIGLEIAFGQRSK